MSIPHGKEHLAKEGALQCRDACQPLGEAAGARDTMTAAMPCLWVCKEGLVSLNTPYVRGSHKASSDVDTSRSPTAAARGFMNNPHHCCEISECFLRAAHLRAPFCLTEIKLIFQKGKIKGELRLISLYSVHGRSHSHFHGLEEQKRNC